MKRTSGDEEDLRRQRRLSATTMASGDHEDFRQRQPSVPDEESRAIGGGVKRNRCHSVTFDNLWHSVPPCARCLGQSDASNDGNDDEKRDDASTNERPPWQSRDREKKISEFSIHFRSSLR